MPILIYLISLKAIRVAMRFLFSVPLLVLGVDGVRSEHHINESMLYTGTYFFFGFGTVLNGRSFRSISHGCSFWCRHILWYYACGVYSPTSIVVALTFRACC